MLKSKYFFPIFLVVAFLLVSRHTFADIAPNPPDCTSINPATGQPGCGYLSFSTTLDASSSADRFVFVIKTSDYDDAGINYSVGDGAFESQPRISSEYIAIDRDYFQSNGGINGIFATSTILAYPDDNDATDTVESMSIKDLAEFYKNSYTFVVSKDDKNLYIDTSRLIDGQYSEYSGIAYEYISTPNLSCTADICSENAIYTPQGIIGNYILVAPSSAEFNPPDANSAVPYVVPGINSTTTIASNASSGVVTQTNVESWQNTVLPPNLNSSPTLQVTVHVFWWNRAWNSVKSFFKSLF